MGVILQKSRVLRVVYINPVTATTSPARIMIWLYEIVVRSISFCLHKEGAGGNISMFWLLLLNSVDEIIYLLTSIIGTCATLRY